MKISGEKSLDQRSKKDDLTLFEKISFAVAGLSFQVQFCALGVFSSVFLLSRAQLPPEKNIYILFVSRAVDAITDPIFGYFIDKSKITRFGKMKPWIFISTPLTAISYSLLWYIPDGFSEDQLFIWFLVWNSAYFTFSTGVRIPHTAMTMYLSDSVKERESATVLRMTFETIGLILALGIQGPLVAFDSTCVNSTFPLTNETTGNLITTDSMMLDEKPTTTAWDQQKYFYISLILNAFFLAGYTILIVFSKEDLELVKASEAKKARDFKGISTWVELKRMFTFLPFVLLCVSSICSRTLIQILQSLLELYFKYGYYKANYLFNYAIMSLLICSIFFVPIWKFLMTKFEKKYLVIIGNITIIPILLGTIFLSENNALEITILFLNLIVGAHGFTAIFVLPWAMLPNSLDAYLLKYGNKLDALFYTIYFVGAKILISIYAAITQLVLSLVGFKTNECFQNENIAIAVKWLMSLGPFILLIIASVSIIFYPINEQKAKEISDQLKEVNKSKDESGDIYMESVEPNRF